MKNEKLENALRTLTEIPMSRLIDHDKLLERMVELSKVQLIANGWPKKKVDKLTGPEASFWAQEQMRQFCGMGPSMQYLEMFGWKRKRRSTPKSNKNVNKKTTRPKSSQ